MWLIFSVLWITGGGRIGCGVLTFSLLSCVENPLCTSISFRVLCFV